MKKYKYLILLHKYGWKAFVSGPETLKNGY